MPDAAIPILLRIHDEAPPSEVMARAALLAEALGRTREIEAKIATRPGEPGERGATIPLVGQLLLSFLGGGAATALVNVLAGWFHPSTTSIELTAEGETIKITGSNLQPERIEPLMEELQSFVTRRRILAK